MNDIPVRITQLEEDDDGQFQRKCILESLSNVTLLPQHLLITSNNQLYHAMLHDCYRHGKVENSISIGIFYDEDDRQVDTLDLNMLNTYTSQDMLTDCEVTITFGNHGLGEFYDVFA